MAQLPISSVPSFVARRRLGVVTGGALLASAWLGAAPVAAAPAPVPDEHSMQWPLGQCVEDKLVAGHLYDVLQDFDQHNTDVGRCSSMGLQCRHAGYDLHRSDAPARTYDDPVLAMADGEVVDLVDWGDEGVGVLVRHDNGLYAHYVHMRKESNVVHVRRGQRVRAGQPLGQIMSYPYGEDNDHLHLEIRPELLVRKCTSGEDCVEATDFVSSCQGNGYALAAKASSIDDLSATAYGFSDPTDAYFDHRPTFPATVAVERVELEYYESADASKPVLGKLPIDALMSSPEAPELIGEDGWYAVSVVEGETTVTRWARGFYDRGFGGDIAIGEVPQIGRDWLAPGAEPLVDLRFGASGATSNWGTGVDATTTGSLRTAPPYASLPTDHCDKVGELDGATSLSVAVGEEASFADGVVVDLSLRLAAFEEGGTIAAAGDATTPTWKLAVRKDDDGLRRLVFEVTTVDEEVQSIVMELPEPRCAAGAVPESSCDGVWSVATSECPASGVCDPDAGMPAHCFDDFGYRQWRHVAARYDVTAGTFELYWDGMSVQRLAATADLLEAEDRTVRIGEGLSAAVDDVRVWALGPAEGGEGSEDDKSDVLDGWGGGSRADEGCACTTGSGTGVGTLPLLLGLWVLRRRRPR